MADALVIESAAKCRLAEEIDAAQERGEVRKDGERGKAVPDKNGFSKPRITDLGLTRKAVYEARTLRNAEGRAGNNSKNRRKKAGGAQATHTGGRAARGETCGRSQCQAKTPDRRGAETATG